MDSWRSAVARVGAGPGVPLQVATTSHLASLHPSASAPGFRSARAVFADSGGDIVAKTARAEGAIEAKTDRAERNPGALAEGCSDARENIKF